jgi:hypothetical protein
MLFAHSKQYFRFKRLNPRGLAGAAEEFLFVATVQNLRRLVRLKFFLCMLVCLFLCSRLDSSPF